MNCARRAAALAFLLAGPMLAQPAGPELRANTVTSGQQVRPSVAAIGTGGDFVVVWELAAGSESDIFGQRFAAAGAPLGGEFRVNTYATGEQSYPRVAGSPDGRFVVVWEGYGPDDGLGVFGRMFDATGAPIFSEFRANTYTSGIQHTASIGMASNDTFTMVWTDARDSNRQVYGQRFSAHATPLGPDFRVNTYTTTGVIVRPVVARAPSEGFLVVREGPGPSDATGIYAQRFDLIGVPQGAEFRVNTYTTDLQISPAAAPLPNGAFVVVWALQYPFLGGSAQIVGQRLDVSGGPLGPQFRVVTSSATSFDAPPAVSSAPDGGFIVTWTEGTQASDIYARRYDPNGAPHGEAFLVNTYTTGSQSASSVAVATPSRFVVAWYSYTSKFDPPKQDVFLQRFALPNGDADGNGSVTVSDVLYLINYLFAGGPFPIGAADADGNGAINVSDVLYLINNLFAGGPAPV